MMEVDVRVKFLGGGLKVGGGVLSVMVSGVAGYFVEDGKRCVVRRASSAVFFAYV